MKSVNPYNNKIIGAYPRMDEQEVSAIIKSSQVAFEKWRAIDFNQKKSLMNNAAQVLKDDKDHYACLITNEMGKPKKESVAEIEKCAWVCEYYAQNAEEFLKAREVTSNAKKSYVRFDPIGIVLAVMPWNFPFWQVFRFAAPTLMAGNVGLLKHASNVSGCSLAIEEVFKKAGFPENVFKSMLVDKNQVSDIIANKYIRAVTLTGSVGAGKAVAKRAGECAKKTVLELGGSDAYIVLDDADLDKAVDSCVKSKMINGGQSCIAAKRFIVQESVHDDFVIKLKEKMQSYVAGDPNDGNTTLGPMVSVEQRDIIHKQVMQSVDKGAKCLIGGAIEEGEGAFYPATILADVKPDMPAYDDEIFGPVASVIRFKDVDEAIKIANGSDFGLGGAVFTKDIKKAEEIATRMDTGNVAINDFVKSDPGLPFGGVKDSGYGRELADFGIREFVNIKTVVIG